MGRHGPIPFPQSEKDLSGNPGKRDDGMEITTAQSSIDPPNHLSDLATEIWNEVAPEMVKAGLLTVLDRETLAVYCEEVATYREAKKDKRKTTKNARGGDQPHPSVRRAKDAAAMIQKLASDLGLTPASRRRLTGLVQPPAATNDDEFQRGQTHPAS